MNKKCSYVNCSRNSWNPIEGEEPYCIFHWGRTKGESERSNEYLIHFKECWEDFILEQTKDGIIEDIDCSGFVFPKKIDFSNKKFEKYADFSDVEFRSRVYIFNASFFCDVDFSNAVFSKAVNFRNTKFSMNAIFINAKFIERASFNEVVINNGVFTLTDFTGANLSYSNFTNCRFEKVKYNIHAEYYFKKPPGLKKFWKILKIIHSPTNFTGIETSGILAASNRQFVRDIHDQQFINQVKEKHKFWYWIWLISSDCGRNFWWFLGWCFLIAFSFGFMYSLAGECWFDNYCDWNWLTPYYYSLVTFSTLGFGDISPKLSSMWGQFAVMIEVFLGYLGLGGLISIFANKLARRA